MIYYVIRVCIEGRTREEEIGTLIPQDKTRLGLTLVSNGVLENTTRAAEHFKADHHVTCRKQRGQTLTTLQLQKPGQTRRLMDLAQCVYNIPVNAIPITEYLYLIEISDGHDLDERRRDFPSPFIV